MEEMKKVPFVANHKDGMHCSQAVFRMLFKYFFNEDLTWKQIDRICKTKPNKASWTMAAHIELAKRGAEVVNVEPFDYERYYQEGAKYLKENFGDKTVEYYLTKSNLLSVRNDIPKFLKVVCHESRRATLDDIKKFLENGYLVGAEINSRILNKRKGFSLHYVLITGSRDGFLILHDPGPPTLRDRKVSVEDFLAALNFPGANGEVTGFKYPRKQK